MDVEKEITDIKNKLTEATNKNEYDAVANRFKIVWKYQQENDPKNNKINKELKKILEDIKEKKKSIDQSSIAEREEKKKVVEPKEFPQQELTVQKETERALSQKEQEELPPEGPDGVNKGEELEHSPTGEPPEIDPQDEINLTSKELKDIDKEQDVFKMLSWKVLDSYFKNNPDFLVNHHLESFNLFMKQGIQKIFKENNPLKYIENRSDEIEKPSIILLYIGGKNEDKIYFGKPVIYDDNNAHFMYPNEARLRNMTYGITIHYDVDVEMMVLNKDTGEMNKVEKTINQVYLGRFPIMVNSDMCILHGLDKEVKYNLGECIQDHGGYFIIDGKEKLIIPEEKFADNMIYVKKWKGDETYSYSAEVRSVSEDSSKPMRTTSVMIVAPNNKYTNNQIVVNLPNVRQPIPLFIVMRALGVISDRDIIRTCLLDLNKYGSYVDLFIPSVHDANFAFDQLSAIKFIATFVKNKSIPLVLNILINMFLTHVGENNFIDKAYYLGYMTKKLLSVFVNDELPTDRDSFLYKRIDLSGTMLYNLFKEYYGIQKNTILMNIDRAYHADKEIGRYTEDFASIMANGHVYFKERVVEIGFKKAFKGNWGSQTYTKKIGVVQDLNRLSWFTAFSHLRKSNLPMPAGAKVLGPRHLNGSQWGYIDVLDVPEGQNIGFQKHLSITSTVTSGNSYIPILDWIKNNIGIVQLTDCSPEFLSDTTKLFINGRWVGNVEDPLHMVHILKLNRRNGIIPIYTSISFRIQNKELFIYSDAGRLIRPIYYVDKNRPSYSRKGIAEAIKNWETLVSGFGKKKAGFNYLEGRVYEPGELYSGTSEEFLDKHRAMVEYIDVSEEETALIAMTSESLHKSKYYTHVEIDPSTILGMMGNCIIFPETNPLPRNNFSGSQSRQAVSLYHTNYQNRIDKMGVLLNYGNIPLVKSRYLKYINGEQIPYGVNCVVAIMSYTGYNVEDAILFNEGSIKRGLFRTSYFSMYEEREESSKISGSDVDSIFANIQNREVVGTKMGYDYSKLDEFGLIREGEEVDDKTILIGKVNISKNGIAVDDSKKPKKGQIGYVDKSFITEGEEGFRIAKIRIREDRLPNVGDKFASRSGQKGTVGYIIPEQNMPFTSQGIRPDLIINPHALPSRMTIGQLVESLLGKMCSLYGGSGDCTAFLSKGANVSTYGRNLQNYRHNEDIGSKLTVSDYHSDLTNIGYHSTGNQLLYNGMNGQQIESNIYVGVNYYMRLKHMVKDKINYRAQGPRNFLTRQSVHGRANDGGLRIGEMERDAIITHGLSTFLRESYMKRADAYKMAVCNRTGLIAIYNEEKDLMISPFADGPLQFQMDVNTEEFTLDTKTRFGRSFTVLEIPYTFKLFIQELQVMGIQMRIITDKNIENMMNLRCTDNIVKLNNTDLMDNELTPKSNKELEKYIKNYIKAKSSALGKGVEKKLKRTKLKIKQDKQDKQDSNMESSTFFPEDVQSTDINIYEMPEEENKQNTTFNYNTNKTIHAHRMDPELEEVDIFRNITNNKHMIHNTENISTPRSEKLKILEVQKEDEVSEMEDLTNSGKSEKKTITLDI
jgi:DNA-directed RNA polymerase II subunit RPB2